MQAALARVSGGRFACGPETTTGYRLPTLPGWVGHQKGIGKPRGRLRRHALISAILGQRLVVPCARAGLASFQDASRFGSRVRWSFRLRPRNDHRLPAANPAGLGWSPERNWEASWTPASARTNPSLMQPWLDDNWTGLSWTETPVFR